LTTGERLYCAANSTVSVAGQLARLESIAGFYQKTITAVSGLVWMTSPVASVRLRKRVE
jgi:hypothetical protein